MDNLWVLKKIVNEFRWQQQTHLNNWWVPHLTSSRTTY